MNLSRRALGWAPLLSGLLVCACAGYVVTPSSAPDIPIPSGAAKVCIVRVGSDGALATFPVRDNGVLVGATIGGSCFCWFAGAGHHEIEARSDGYDSFELDLKADHEHFIVQATRAAVGIVRSRMEELTADEGKVAMKSCQYHALTQVPQGTYQAKPNMVVGAK